MNDPNYSKTYNRGVDYVRGLDYAREIDYTMLLLVNLEKLVWPEISIVFGPARINLN